VKNPSDREFPRDALRSRFVRRGLRSRFLSPRVNSLGIPRRSRHNATVHSKILTQPLESVIELPPPHRRRTPRVWSRPVAREGALRTLRTRLYAPDAQPGARDER
jgi:hypothetical protein